MSNKIEKTLKSRTVWTIIALFIINGISGVKDFIPENLLPLIDSLLGLAAIYFKVNPSQDYK